jgi:hypothetical protein
MPPLMCEIAAMLAKAILPKFVKPLTVLENPELIKKTPNKAIIAQKISVTAGPILIIIGIGSQLSICLPYLKNFRIRSKKATKRNGCLTGWI